MEVVRQTKSGLGATGMLGSAIDDGSKDKI
jgi:hypothetical protein